MSEALQPFRPGSRYTIGVEIEFQILDRRSYDLAPRAPMLLSDAPAILRPRLALELIKSILEIQTGVCSDLRDVENDLLQTCSLAEELAADDGCLLYAASLHPFARADQQELSDDVRYERIIKDLQFVGRRFISQGLHVHIGLPDGDTAIRVGNRVQALLPIFLALSTSSPYFQGVDTGMMSYRTKLFEVLPLAGIYHHLTDWDHFAEEFDFLLQHGIIESYHDLWWDVRPNPIFGTLEIRICDLPTKFTDILGLVALIQSSIAWLAEDPGADEPLKPYVLQANKWQAARYGLNGRFIDPAGLLGDGAMNLRLAAMLLKKKVAACAAELKAASYLQSLDSIIAGGTGADVQRHVYGRTSDFREVIAELHRGFWK